MPKYANKELALKAIQLLIDNGMEELATLQLKENGIKAIIKNGRLLDESDVTEKFLDSFVTNDPDMLVVKSDIRKLSTVEDEVLIVGDTGTGKEILANALHGKREGNFVACNASGLPENLIESELFGHVRGAFTGAMSEKVGLIRFATHGTFFLDEIGELPLEAQSKLLRAIQNRTIRKVGGNDSLSVECRFVFATNRDLPDMVERGQFRADLLARISTFTIETKPLVKRSNDIELILTSLGGQKLVNEVKIKKLPYPSTPFNVRSLQQWVKRYQILGRLPS